MVWVESWRRTSVLYEVLEDLLDLVEILDDWRCLSSPRRTSDTTAGQPRSHGPLRRRRVDGRLSTPPASIVLSHILDRKVLGQAAMESGVDEFKCLPEICHTRASPVSFGTIRCLRTWGFPGANNSDFLSKVHYLPHRYERKQNHKARSGYCGNWFSSSGLDCLRQCRRRGQ